MIMLYDVVSRFYDKLYGEEQLRKFRAASRLSGLFRPGCRRPNVVLDAGCGVGLITELLCSCCGYVVGLDFSRGMIRRAVERLKRFRNVDLILGDVEALPFRPRSFDLVLSLTVLQNCLSPLRALKGLLRCLARRGVAIVSYFKRARNVSRVEKTYGGLVVRDVDPSDNLLVLAKGVSVGRERMIEVAH